MKKLSYAPLWKLLIDKKMNKGDLQKAAQLSRGTITKMGKDEPVGLDIVVRICTALNCNVYDVIEVLDTSGTERIARSEGRGT